MPSSDAGFFFVPSFLLSVILTTTPPLFPPPFFPSVFVSSLIKNVGEMRRPPSRAVSTSLENGCLLPDDI
jgi:hypothetical protein